MGKKIGILSMQRVINYGSYLQAYALKQLLLEAGAESVDFIDIKGGRPLVEYHPSSFKKRLRTAIAFARKGRLFAGVKDFLFLRRLTKSIRDAWPILKLDNPDHITFDLVVIGSDEVFNCTQSVWWGYSTQLFGDIPPSVSPKSITYAASFGYTKLEDLQKYGIDSEIAKHLRSLDAISVRDKNSQDIVRHLTGIEAPIHIDPVLIYGYNREIEDMTESPIAEPYMVVYSYQGRIEDPSEIEAITSYAATHNLRIISVYCRYDWCDKAVLPSTPIEVLRWFKFAHRIITDTFHGAIFSIITRSNFVAVIRPSNHNKLHFLLKSLCLENREWNGTMDLINIFNENFTYTECDKMLDSFREQAKIYLLQSTR